MDKNSTKLKCWVCKVCDLPFKTKIPKCVNVNCSEFKPRLKRLPVPIDEKVIIELQGLIQARTQKRMSMAAIVRFALEELLKTEAELAE